MQELERTGENFFQNLSILTHDPPDVIAETFVGKLIGVEVTELVDEKAVRQHQKGNEYFKFWSGKEIVEKIQNIINSKDIKVFYGGPYEKIILLIIQMSRFCLMKNSKNIFQLIVLIRQIK